MSTTITEQRDEYLYKAYVSLRELSHFCDRNNITLPETLTDAEINVGAVLRMSGWEVGNEKKEDKSSD